MSGWPRADPDNTGHQRDLAVTLQRVGNVRAARGDADGALAAYTRALDISERLARADPDNTGHQRDLAVNLDRVGGVRAARGDAEGALAAYTRCPAHQPSGWRAPTRTTPNYQYDVFVAAYKLASLLEPVGDPSAVDHWAKAHKMLARLDSVGRLADTHRQVFDYVTQKIGGH